MFHDLYDKIVKGDPALQAGVVVCVKCKRKMKVDSAECLRKGWPKCCGSTMMLQSLRTKDAGNQSE